jgi:hypothetical protein
LGNLNEQEDVRRAGLTFRIAPGALLEDCKIGQRLRGAVELNAALTARPVAISEQTKEEAVECIDTLGVVRPG